MLENKNVKSEFDNDQATPEEVEALNRQYAEFIHGFAEQLGELMEDHERRVERLAIACKLAEEDTIRVNAMSPKARAEFDKRIAEHAKKIYGTSNEMA